MLTAVVTLAGESVVSVAFASDSGEAVAIDAVSAEASAGVAETKVPNPIAPEVKEMLWSFGPFLVFLVIMRYFLFPRLRKGMDARYESIRANLEGADAAKADAREEVAKYEAALVEVRAEAAKRLDAARQTLDQERQSAIAEVNARIAAKKADADAVASAERAAAQGQISIAVASVTTSVTSLAMGKPADAGIITQAVTEVMQSAGARS